MHTDLCSIKDWELLSISDSGEAVIGYNKEDVFVVTKLRAVKMSKDDGGLYSAYVSRLCEEAVIVRIDQDVVNDQLKRLWSLRLLTLDTQMVKYVLYASTVYDGHEYVIESTFLTATDYLEFMKNFANFAASIKFELLLKEAGKLTFADVSVTAIGIPGIVLQSETRDDALLFIGKDKYFAVTITTASQKDILFTYMTPNIIEFISTSNLENGSVTRYRTLNEDTGEVTGVVELFSKEVSGKFVEVLGYWTHETTTSINDCVKLQISEGSVDE